jgi:hypothetical protein
MFLRIHIDLTPVVWTHTLSHAGATVLRAQAKCAPGGKCDLRLRNGAKIADYELALTILNGEITVSDRQKYTLIEEAIGGLWFVDDEHVDELIHGWFFMNPNAYAELWEQVRGGGYSSCIFSLEVGPVEGAKGEEVWRNNALSILSASISFARRRRGGTGQQSARERWLERLGLRGLVIRRPTK